MPAMPVLLSGKVSGFLVRKTCRSSSQVSSRMARYCGSRWPEGRRGQGAQDALRDRAGAGAQEDTFGRISSSTGHGAHVHRLA